MKKEEQVLLESFKTLLQHDAKLGLRDHNQKETSHVQWHQWEGIDDMFALKASKSTFCEGLTSSFHSVHSYKYIDDPTFPIAMEKSMTARGIPAKDRQVALKYIQEIIEELSKGSDWSEKDAGWNPNMDEIIDVTRNADKRDAKTSEPFTGGGPAPKEGELK